MSFEARLDVTVADYFTMIAGKTARCWRPPELGALVAGAAPDMVAAYHDYGAHLGRVPASG